MAEMSRGIVNRRRLHLIISNSESSQWQAERTAIDPSGMRNCMALQAQSRNIMDGLPCAK